MFSQIIGLFQFGAKEFHRILSKWKVLNSQNELEWKKL